MKKLRFAVLSAMAALLVFSMISCDHDNDNDPSGPYAGWPVGKVSGNGMLTITNKVNEEVLVFDGTVVSDNYIGTIPPTSEITVKLEANKFHTIIGVCKSAYDEKGDAAAQTSALTYYSDSQAYKISVSPDNLTGAGTWIFNNYTSYWAQIEDVNGTGTTYAVIQPNALRVKIPVQLNTPYDYKITYKKELKYNNKILAIADSTVVSQNDTVYLTEDTTTTYTTSLEGTSTSLAADLAPSVMFINNSGKSVRVYNGQVQLANISSSSTSSAEDFVVISGTTAMLTGFTAGTTATSLKVSSVAWTKEYYCTESLTMEKGKVYRVTLTANTDTTSGASPVVWTVKEEEASAYYDEE